MFYAQSPKYLFLRLQESIISIDFTLRVTLTDKKVFAEMTSAINQGVKADAQNSASHD